MAAKASILLFLLFGFSNLFAQFDSLAKQDKTLLLIRSADSIRIADSIQKEALQSQLQALVENEISKRKEIEQQLLILSRQDSLNRVAKKNEIDSLRHTAKGFPVAPYKDTLYFIYTKIGEITAAERAEIVNNRLKDLYRTFTLKLDTLQIVDLAKTVEVHFKGRTIFSITDYDAMWFEKPKREIAESYRNLIRNDIAVYRADTSVVTVIKHIGLALLVIFLQIILIRLVNKFFTGRIDPFIKKNSGKRKKGLILKEYKFIDEENETKLFLFTSRLLRWVLNLLQLYLTIPILFSIFPPTQRIAEALFGYILTPLKKIGVAFVDYIPNLFAIIVIVVITRYFIKFLRYLANEVAFERLKIAGFYPDWAKPTFNIVRFLSLAFMFVVIFPYLPGSDSPVFQGVSVFLGIIFSFGSSSIISNLVAGLVMTYMRPFQLGDRIRLGDMLGDVVEKTSFVTRIKTSKNEFITIPNSIIMSSNVMNYSTSKQDEGVILYTTVTIGYDAPWKQVHELLINAAKKTTYILDTPEPFVLQTSLDDFYVSYQINAYSDEPNKQARIYSELHQNIQDSFNESGVEILSPHYRGQRDGNRTTIPENYLPDDYKAPGFKIENDQK